MVFLASCIYAFKLVFKSLSSLPSHFQAITGLELHWMGDRPVGGKEEKKSAIWSFSRRTVVRSSRAEQYDVHVQAAEIFKVVSKYFGILPRASPFYSLAATDMHIYLFLLF